MRTSQYQPGSGLKAWWAKMTPAERSAHALKGAATRARRRSANDGVRTRRRRHRLGNKPTIDPRGADGIRIEKMYEAGYSGPVIARKMHAHYPRITAGVIYTVLKHRGVDRRPMGRTAEETNGTEPEAMAFPAAALTRVDMETSPVWDARAQLERMKAQRERLDKAITALEEYCHVAIVVR